VRFVSLFSGVGGFDLGLEAAGWECVAQVEWDQHCQSVLARHWPDVPKWHDVSDVAGADLPAADAVVFGSPCQDLSVAGKRAGFDGERSVLFYEAIRIIKEMQDVGRGPAWVVWENVVGALSSSQGRDFAAVLDALADIGALDIAWRVLDARFFGVPQRRRRVFVVAHLAGHRAGEVFAEPEGVRWHPHPSLAPWATAAAATGSGAAQRGGSVTPMVDWAGSAQHVDVAAPLLASRGGLKTSDIDGATWVVNAAQAVSGNQRGELLLTDYSHQLTTGGGKPGQGYPAVLAFSAGNSGNSFGIGLTEDGTPPLGAGASGTNQVPTIVIPIQDGREIDKAQNGLGVADVGAPAYTLDRTGAQSVAIAFHITQDPISSTEACPSLGHKSTGQGIHTATRVRRLTPVECERLMGWPDDHTRWRADGTEVADSHRYRMCGNGVAAVVAQWLGERISEVQR
jgi:DNA (cytosine-5)-methyltransferase 1